MTKEYPHYTPYQFAGNSPIFAVDLDGLEEAPFHFMRVEQKIRENRANMTPEQLKKDKELELKVGLGVSAVPVLIYGAVVAGPFVTSGALTTTTAAKISTTTTGAMVWAANNPQTIQTTSEFIFGIVYDGPDDLFPASGADNGGKTLKKAVKAIFDEDGFAVFRDAAGKIAGKGWLEFGGELNLSIKTVGTEVQGKGADVFNSILDFVNKNYNEVQSIKGTWRAGEMADNLNTFNKLVKEVGAEKAALQTFTGKMADRAGFNKAVVTLGAQDSNGNYLSVDVLFKKE